MNWFKLILFAVPVLFVTWIFASFLVYLIIKHLVKMPPAWVRHYFCRVLPWHGPTTWLGFDGCSVHARCTWCGKEGMYDSQGNFF